MDNVLVKPFSTDCACVGIDDAITVFITVDSLANKVKTLLAEKTGLNIRAFKVKIVQSIPKKPSGKIDYSQLT